jgi:hypothetical protein
MQDSEFSKTGQGYASLFITRRPLAKVVVVWFDTWNLDAGRRFWQNSDTNAGSDDAPQTLKYRAHVRQHERRTFPPGPSPADGQSRAPP